MSTTILKRTVLYEKRDGEPFRFSDWAIVVAKNVGTCAEPFSMTQRMFTNNEYDFEDDMSRIDLMQNIDIIGENVILSGGGSKADLNANGSAIYFMGGIMQPRDGR